MNKPQIIETPGGAKLAVVPLEEFERLTAAAEDAADVRAFDEAMRKIESGEDEMIPAEFANRLIDGENPVRVWRDFRGLTAQALAGRAGLNRATVTMIETGRRKGNVETLQALAAALKVTIDDLV